MYTLSGRCKNLRERAISHADERELNGQRDYWFARGLDASESKNNAGRMADGMISVIENMFPYVGQDELIVGNNFGIYEYVDLDDTRARAQLKDSLLTPEQIDWYQQNRERIYAKFDAKQYVVEREQDRELMEEKAAFAWAMTANHTCIGYADVLQQGFSGICERIESYIRERGDADGFYGNLKKLCLACASIGEKYAATCEEQLQAEKDPVRKEELQKIVGILHQVPAKPARTFHEAVQSLWFAHILNTFEDTINANSLGRLDQILYPYYKDDIENGRITKEETFELICCLWIKLYRDYDVQQSCVGGRNADGSSAVNELSYMMLEATERLDFIRCLSVRFDADTDEEFILRALKVVGHVKKGVPFFFNDQVMVPALIGAGIAREDAYDYTDLGCVETVIPGKCNPHAVVARVNALKAIEYTFGEGKSMLTPSYCPGIRTKELSQISDFEDFRREVFKQLKHLIARACFLTADMRGYGSYNDPKPYKSLLTEGCLERGRDYNDEGALYDYYQVMLLGVPNLADSLCAVKKLVFESKKYSLQDVYTMLAGNFPSEAQRLEFINKAPKFGNDNEEVDSIAAEILSFCCDRLEEESKKCGISFHAQPFTFLWMVEHGELTAATPDGRRKGEIFAYSLSPMQGRDFNGFTALLNSLCSLPTKRTPGTTSAIVEVDPILFTDENLPVFAQILLSAAEKGLSNVQFNITDRETLIDAQKHPEKHRNLAVRVSGFSQKFELLSKEMQDHIIQRTKHKAL